MSTIEVLRSYIINELGYTEDPSNLTADFQLVDNGVVDSLGLFQIIGFIEEEFSVQVDDEELVVENFATLGDMERMVAEKHAAAG